MEDWQGAIKTVHHLLKPEGLFVSSTACVKHLWPLRLLAPIGQFAGLIPTLSFFSGEELKQCLIEQGFEIEHFWQPQKTREFLLLLERSDVGLIGKYAFGNQKHVTSILINKKRLQFEAVFINIICAYKCVV